MSRANWLLKGDLRGRRGVYSHKLTEGCRKPCFPYGSLRKRSKNSRNKNPSSSPKLFYTICICRWRYVIPPDSFPSAKCTETCAYSSLMLYFTPYSTKKRIAEVTLLNSYGIPVGSLWNPYVILTILTEALWNPTECFPADSFFKKAFFGWDAGRLRSVPGGRKTARQRSFYRLLCS